MPMPHRIGDALLWRYRLDFDAAHQVMAGRGQQLEFFLRRTAALLCQSIAVMPLRQQILEVGGPFAVAAGESAVIAGAQDFYGVFLALSLITQGQYRTLRIGDIRVIEGHPQDIAVFGQIADRSLALRTMQIES